MRLQHDTKKLENEHEDRIHKKNHPSNNLTQSNWTQATQVRHLDLFLTISVVIQQCNNVIYQYIITFDLLSTPNVIFS